MHCTKLQLSSVLALPGTQLSVVSIFAHTFLAINILMFTTQICACGFMYLTLKQNCLSWL